MNLDDAEERQIAAADYVLGRMRESDRILFEDRLESDTALRSVVEEWRARLSPVVREPSHPESPSSSPIAVSQADPQPTPVSPAAESSEEERAGAKTEAALARQLQRRLDLWRMLAFAGAVTAAAFAFFLFGQSPLRYADREGARFVAVLVPADGGGRGWLVRIGGGQPPRISATPLADAEPVEGASLHLWALPGDDSAPLSLGQVPSAAPDALHWPDTAAMPPQEGVGLVMSLERDEGSPPGRPGGPVVFSGELVNSRPD